MNPLDTNTGKLFVAESGGGKGNLMVWLLLFLIRRSLVSVRAYFPHIIDAYILIRELIAFFGHAIIDHLLVEDLDSVRRLIPRQNIARPRATTYWDREKEIADIISQTLERWLQMRPDLEHIDERQNFADLGTLALQVFLNLDCPFPESMIGDIIVPGSPEWRFCLAHCTSESARVRLERLDLIATRDWLTSILATKRFIDRTQKSIAIAARSDAEQTVDWKSFYDAGGIYIGYGGLKSVNDLRTIIGCDFHHDASLARDGLVNPHIFLGDELLNYHLFTRAMATGVPSLRFTRMQPWLATTGLFPDEFLTQTVFQNLSILAGPIGDPHTADYVARAFRGMMDEHHVHHFSETIRTTPVIDYEERITHTESKKHGESVSMTIVPVTRHREWIDRQPVYQPANEQSFWLAKRFQEFPIGTFAVRERGRAPWIWQVPLVKDSWAFPGLGDMKVTEWINNQYQTHWAYVTPRPPAALPEPAAAPAEVRNNTTRQQPNVPRATRGSSRSPRRSR